MHFYVHIRGERCLQCERGVNFDAVRGTARASVEECCEGSALGQTSQFAPRMMSPHAILLRQMGDAERRSLQVPGCGLRGLCRATVRHGVRTDTHQKQTGTHGAGPLSASPLRDTDPKWTAHCLSRILCEMCTCHIHSVPDSDTGYRKLNFIFIDHGNILLTVAHSNQPPIVIERLYRG